MLLALVGAGIVSGDQHLSAMVPHALWEKLRIIDFPYKASICIPVIITILTIALHFAFKANNFRNLLLILLIIALQSNGIKLGPGLDLVSLLPFFIFLFLLAEALRRPTNTIELSGLMFFAMLLLLLDLPYLANLTITSPIAFVLNFISVLRPLMLAFVLINLVQNERQFELAIKATIVVAIVSAFIGILQIILDRFMGITWTLLEEDDSTKPTFVGFTLRASGLAAWSSWLAEFMLVALPFMLFRLLNARTSRAIVGYVLGIGISLAGIVFTFVYASYIAAGVILALFPFVYWPHRTIHFLVTILFFGVIFFALGGFDWFYDAVWVEVSASSGMVERKVYLLSTVQELARDPWLGSGFYSEQSFSENFYLKRVHNTGLQAWANLGLPGFIVFMTMMLTVLTQLWLLALSRRGHVRQLFQALGLVVIAMIVTMFAQPHLSSPIVWYCLALSHAAIRIWNYPRRSLAHA